MSSYCLGDPLSDEHKERVWEELAARGAIRAEVRYSGGHDEGSADSIALIDAGGEPFSLTLPDWKLREEWTDEQKADQQFADDLESAIYVIHGSFAGEFSVQGIVTWWLEAGDSDEDDGEARTVTYTETFSVTNYETHGGLVQ